MYNPEGQWKNGANFLLCGEDNWPNESNMGNRVVRIIAWILRFYKIIKQQIQKMTKLKEK